MAIVGMLLWLIGIPCTVFGAFASLGSAAGSNPGGLGGAVAALFIGFGICFLAFWICRSVYGIANGTERNPVIGSRHDLD